MRIIFLILFLVLLFIILKPTIFDYYNEIDVQNNSLFTFLKTYQFENKKRYGGYVIAELDGNYDCFISAGVNNEESFSRDFLNTHPLHKEVCFAFDKTITNYPHENINLIKKNIGRENTDMLTNLSFLIKKYEDIFLKMNIEGGEYPWIESLSEKDLQKFKQIVIKFHGIQNDHWGTSPLKKLDCLKKLHKTHYIVHADGDNSGEIYNNLPDILDLTYIRKNYFHHIPFLNEEMNGMKYYLNNLQNIQPQFDLNFAIKNKIIIITTSMIMQDYDLRKEEYIKAITKLVQRYRKNDKYTLIIIENTGSGTQEFLESLWVDKVIYTNNNQIDTPNKGVKELTDLHFFLNAYKIPNDTFIVKITGRYIIEDKCPFFDIVDNLTDKIDAVAKFGFGGTFTACDTGLIGLRCGYIKQIKMPNDFVSVEEHWGDMIRNIPEEKVVKLSLLGIQTCPASHTYNLV